MKWIEDLRSSVDIVEIVGRFVSLKRVGPSYKGCCPFHDDKHESLDVHPEKQIFKCFACGAGAGDVVDFLKLKGYSLDEARAYLAGEQVQASGEAAANKVYTRKASTWQEVIGHGQICNDFSHYKHGLPSKIYTYRTELGTIRGYICRFDLPNGKEFSPLVWASNGDRAKWSFSGFRKPRPLYNLDAIREQPEAVIVVVEGEKCADHLGERMPHLIVTTWQGGANGVQHTDWSPLAGRKVIIWPDHDEPGYKAADEIALHIDAPAALRFVHNPIDAEVHWDCADADWATAGFKEYMRANLHDTPRAVIAPEISAELPAQDQEEEPPEPAYIDAAPPVQHYIPENLENDYLRILGWDKVDDGMRYVVFSKWFNQIIYFSANNIKHHKLIEVAPLMWWESEFPGKDGANLKAVASWLSSVAQYVGKFNDEQIRGRGAWMDAGRIIIHNGSHLIVDGKYVKLNDYTGKFIYQEANTIGINTDFPLKKVEAARLFDVLKHLNWDREINNHLLAGWCVIAPVCGALKWRPHIWVTGEAGTGKSWVFSHIVKRLLGSSVVDAQGNTSEAGIRQELEADARPIIFDEAEAENRAGQARMTAIIELMRAASTDNSGHIIKGSAGGQTKKYHIRSCFAFASIGVSVSQQSDVSRVTLLSLIKEQNSEIREDKWKELQRSYNEVITDEFIDRLQARTVSLLPIIIKNTATFAAAAAAELGAQRAGDQLGALLAGAYSLTSDSEIAFESAQKWIRSKDWTQEKATDKDNDQMNLFAKIMERSIRIDQGVERTIGELVQMAAGLKLNDIGSDMSKATLNRIGIKVEGDFIVIGNSVDGIKNILRDTQWAKNHNKILMRIKGARGFDSTRFAAGVHSRAVGVPLSLLK